MPYCHSIEERSRTAEKNDDSYEGFIKGRLASKSVSHRVWLIFSWCIQSGCLESCRRSFLVYLFIMFACVSYGRFMAICYKFNLSTFVQEPLVIGRRGCTGRDLNEERLAADNGHKQSSKGRFTHSMPFPCLSPAMPCVNSHMPCSAPALLRQCRVLRECPHGSRKYPTAGPTV